MAHRTRKGNMICRFHLINTLNKKIKFSIKNFFSNYEQIRSSQRIWSHLLEKTIMENFIFCAVIFMVQFDTWRRQ